MITQVHFEKFKSLDNVTLDLGRLTVLVGPNGCGKSSVLQGIDLLSQMGVAQPEEHSFVRHRFGAIFEKVRAERFTSKERPIVIVLAASQHDGDTLELRIELSASEDAGTLDGGIAFRLHVDGPQGVLKTSTVPPALFDQRILDHVRVRRFGSVVYLHLDAVEMSRVHVARDVEPSMHDNGSGLPSVLAWMKGAAEEELEKITKDLARVVPGVKRIRTKRERVSTRAFEQLNVDGQLLPRAVQKDEMGDRFEIEFDNGQSIPADLLSEGTVLALGLLTKLREPKRPRLVLLDDVDRGLHIEAQAKFVHVIRELLSLDPELQIVCTTHSPYLLDLFGPEEVRVLALDEKRHTRAMKLTEHPEFDKWRFGVQTGELYASVGDAWVVGQPERTP